MSPFRSKGAEVSDEACGKEAPREAPAASTFETIPALPDGEIENICGSDDTSGGEPDKERD